MEVLNSKTQLPAMTSTSMVERYLKPRGITDARVLKAMAEIPRHLFVAEALKERAYSDHPLPIGQDQTISQPYIVALMTEALKLKGNEKVLEIGTGSGYQTAILAKLARSIFSIERHSKLAMEARKKVESIGFTNVSIRTANGALGWKEFAPFDRILVTASAESLPPTLFEQLTESGRIVIPIGSSNEPQQLFAIDKKNGKEVRTFLCYCSFVPFVS